MEKKKWLIVTDLDGTALQDHTSLNKDTVKVFKRAMENGHVVCIATGRPPRAAIEFYNEIGLNTLMANYNGSIICNPGDDSFEDMHFMINNEIVTEILNNKEIMQHVGHWMMEREDKISTNLADGILFNHFHVHGIDEIVNDKEYINIEKDLNSVILQIKSEEGSDKIIKILNEYSSSIVVRPWSLVTESSFIIEINSKRGNKGNALKIMAEYYNIPLNRTIAFGDMPNDNEMIMQAGVGVVMGNGHPELKDKANFILEKSNKEPAIKEFLENNLKLD